MEGQTGLTLGSRFSKPLFRFIRGFFGHGLNICLVLLRAERSAQRAGYF